MKFRCALLISLSSAFLQNAQASEISCSPKTLYKGDVLTIKLKLPHGGDFAVTAPNKHNFWLSSTNDYVNQDNLIAAYKYEGFRALSTIQIDTAHLKITPFVFGKTKPELVFNQTGRYRFVISDNWATDDGTPAYFCYVKFINSHRKVNSNFTK